MAAPAAVAAVGAAFWDEFFTPETACSVAALARNHIYFNQIYEHLFLLSRALNHPVNFLHYNIKTMRPFASLAKKKAAQKGRLFVINRNFS
jgi:hypothetical protein